MGMLLVGGTQYLTFVRPGGAQKPFEVHAGHNVLHPAVAVFVAHLGIERLKAGRQNDGPYVDIDLLRLLLEIDGVVLADVFADAALLLFQVKTALIDIGDKRDGLRKINMDGFVLRYLLIEFVRVMNRAVFSTGRAPRAPVLYDVPGVLDQRDPEVSRLAFDTVNFGMRQDLYVRMPADLDQFGREYSHGAVIGREGLVELGHVAANGGGFLDQIHLEPGGRKIKGGLNAADPAADHHDISKFPVYKTLAKLVNFFL